MKKSLLLSLLMAAVCTMSFAAPAPDPYKDAVKAARAAQKEKNNDEALKCYETALAAAKDVKQKNDALMSAAGILFGQKKYDEAAAKVKEANALEGLPAKSKASNLTFLARVYHAQKKGAEKTAALQEALKLVEGTPASANVLMDLARDSRNAKKLDEAEKYAKSALETAQKNNARPGQLVGINSFIAENLAAQNKLDEALKTLDEAGKIAGITDAQKAGLFRCRVGLLSNAKKYAEANALLEEAAKNSNDADVKINCLNNIARNWQSAKEYDKAIAAIDQAIQIVGAKKAQPNVKLKASCEKAKEKAAAQEAKAKAKAEKAAKAAAPAAAPAATPAK